MLYRHSEFQPTSRRIVMKLRYLILFFIILFLIGGPPQVRSQNKNQKADYIKVSKSFPKLSSFGTIVQNGNFVLWHSAGDKFYLKGIDGKVKIPRKLESFQVFAAVLSSNDRNPKLALGSVNGTIFIQAIQDTISKGLNYKGPKKARSMKGHNKSDVTAVAFSPDEQTLASGAKDGTIVVWDIVTAEQLFPLSGHKGTVNTIAFSPDGRYLASGAADGSVKLWALFYQQELPLLTGHKGAVNTVAFSPDPDNKIIASGGQDGSIILWRISNELNGANPTLLNTLDTPHGDVKTIVFSPDRIHLASGGLSGTVFLWNIQDTQNVKEIDIKQEYRSLYEEIRKGKNVKTNFVSVDDDTHQDNLLSIVFSHNGRDLLSVSRDCYVEWELSGIGINPEPNTLIIAEKPSPLIKELRERDESGPVVVISNKEDIAEVAPGTTKTTVSGTAKDNLSKISSLIVQDKLVSVGENGEFSASVKLKEGENKIRFVAKDDKGNEGIEILTINCMPIPDTTEPTVTVTNTEFNDANLAVVEYEQKNFNLQVTATDDKSGIKEVRVNGRQAEVQVENGQFIAQVPLTEGETKIRVVAEDNSGNESEAKEITIRRKPEPDTETPVIVEGPKKPETPIPPTTDPAVGENAGNQPERSTSSPVEILISDPEMIENQVELLRAYPEDKPTCEVSGLVENYQLASNYIDIIVKSKTEGSIKKPIEYSKRLLQLGKSRTFKFKDLPLFPGENEITLKIDLKDGSASIIKRFLIQRTSSQPPDRPIQPPGPVEPPTISLPVQKEDSEPPTLEINVHEESNRGTKGTQQDANSQNDVHEVTEISALNTEGNEFVTTKEEVLFEGKVTDDISKPYNLKLEIVGIPVEVEKNGRFEHSHPLEYGENQITITVTDEAGRKATEAYTVYHRPDRNGKDFALFFAMEKYNEADGWGKLYTPYKDVQLIAEQLEKSYGFITNVIRDPKKQDIKDQLVIYQDKFIDKNGKTIEYSNDSQLLIYFSGHGFSKKRIKFDGKEEKLGFIAPIDSVSPEKNKDLAESRSFSFENLRKDINDIHPRRILVLLDTCESGYFDPTFRPDRSPSTFSSNDPMEKIKNNFKMTSRWYLTATGKEKALDGTIDKSQSSPFAEAFLKALDSQGSEDHLLEVSEVEEFIMKTKDHSAYKELGMDVPEPLSGQFASGQPGSNFIFFPLPPILKE